MAITEFLLARYDDLEPQAENAHRAHQMSKRSGLSTSWSWAQRTKSAARSQVASLIEGAPSPDDVLSDLYAKRLIVEDHTPVEDVPGTPCPSCAGWNGNYSSAPETVDSPCRTLRLLARPYTDHPDYDESWKP